MKPKLPSDVEYLLPEDVVRYLYTFVPHYEKKKKSPPPSPSLQKELLRIQTKSFKGKNEMYMYDFMDFVLD